MAIDRFQSLDTKWVTAGWEASRKNILLANRKYPGMHVNALISLLYLSAKCISYAWFLGILLTGGKSEEGSTYCTDIYGAWWDLWWDFVCVCLEYGLVSRIPVTTATKHLWHSRKSWHLFASDLLTWQRKARERMAGDIYVQSFTSSTWLTVLCRICLQWELRASQSPNISWDKQPPSEATGRQSSQNLLLLVLTTTIHVVGSCKQAGWKAISLEYREHCHG